MSAKDQETLLQEDISAIDEKRRVLEQIVSITQAIERMQESLDSVLVLGVASKDIPEGALNLYSALSENLRNLPVKKIQEYQKNLEAVISNQLEKILQYSGIDFNAEEAVDILYLNDGNEGGGTLELLEDFKRTAQTAVSLRVLLRKRGVATPGATLPVPKEMVNRQLQHLHQQEQQQRGRIKSKVAEMRTDIEHMLENPAYPAGMKKLLLEVRENLDRDIKKLDAGGALSTLSFVADAQELTAIQEPPEAIEIEIEAVPVAPEREMSFSEAAGRWLSTPWDVSWREIKNAGRN